jgi:hypothetical protein
LRMACIAEWRCGKSIPIDKRPVGTHGECIGQQGAVGDGAQVPGDDGPVHAL